MFKLGEYDEIEAEEIADYLREAGIRVDLRPSLSAERDETTFLEGRLSEIRESVDDFDKYDQYLEAMRKVLAEGPSRDDFTISFLKTLDPEWEEKREKIAKMFEEGVYTFPDGTEMEDEDLSMEDKIYWLNNIFGSFESIGFSESILEINEIELEEGVPKQLDDDPMLRLPADEDEYDPDDPLVKTTITIEFDKRFDIYLDEMTTPLIDDVDEGFMEDYSDEYLRINSLGILIDHLFDPPESAKKISLDEFRELCELELGGEKITMRIDGSFVAEEIAKVLEKKGILKVRGDKVAWKKRRS